MEIKLNNLMPKILVCLKNQNNNNIRCPSIQLAKEFREPSKNL